MKTENRKIDIPKRIGIMIGAGYIPGINSVFIGAAMAAAKNGWELVGIRDGFEGILHPENYPEGGLLTLNPQLIENLDTAAGSILGQSARIDPFQVRTINEYEMVEEVDMSDELIKRLKENNIDALIAVVGAQGLSIMYMLHKKGLNTICIPRTIDNEIAGTSVCFGFNSALTKTIEMLDIARKAAKAARKIAVVEVQGRQAGWIALQAGIASRADAILIPEMPCDLKNVAAVLKAKISKARPFGLVVIAEGAKIINKTNIEEAVNTLKSALSPLATGGASDYVIKKSGQAAETVADELQLLIAEETYPLVIGPWVRGGTPTAVDRQLGMAYGAGAVTALKKGKDGVMVSFVPPDIKFVPLSDAINKIRVVAADNEFLKTAESLGIYIEK